MRHLIATWCEPHLDREQDKAEAGAWLQLDRRPDGRLAGRFIISSEDSEALLTVLEPLARRQGLADARSAGQRRAEALVEVFTAATHWLELPSAGGRPVHVSYIVPSGWARAGQAPALADLLTGGHLTLLSPDTAGQTTQDPAPPGPQPSAPSRVLRDAFGQVHSLQTLTDQITTTQRKAVSARDRHCTARGCTRPPAFTDLHHLNHRQDGGTTTINNLLLPCRRHHLMWHRGRLTLTDLHTPWLTTHAA